MAAPLALLVCLLVGDLLLLAALLDLLPLVRPAWLAASLLPV